MNNVPPPNETDKTQYVFYPHHLFVESVAAVLVLGVIVLLSIVWQVPLEEMADPGDTSYVPRPEWYFLFYFQMLKYFEGSLIVVGTFILPVLALAALFLLPFFDRSQTTAIRKRPVVAAVSMASVGLIVALTALSVMEDESHSLKMDLPPITEEQIAAGEKTFNTFCMMCHKMEGKGGFMAPDLTQIGARATRAYIEQVIIDPQTVSPTTIMSVIPLSDAERHEVSAYLSRKR
jgi:ubiquinol-cytochrome c reductase cytochrome b subunit